MEKNFFNLKCEELESVLNPNKFTDFALSPAGAVSAWSLATGMVVGFIIT